MTDTPNAPWVDGLTIDQVFRTTVAEFSGQLAVAFCESNWQRTWAELAQEVEIASRGLLAMGIGKGDHVAVWATNVPQWVILQFATARIGAVLVAINPACRSHELAYALKQSDTKALFLIDQFKSSNYLQMFRQACPEIENAKPGNVNCPGLPQLKQIVLLRGELPDWAISWREMIKGGATVKATEVEQIAASQAPADPINIQYTSGTTGLPKATMLSHRNLLMNAFYVGQRQRLTAADRICVPVPFYHCFGCVLGSLCSLVYGAAMIIPAEFFNPRKTLQAIEQHRASALYGVPTMFIAELQEPDLDEFDTGCLRTGIMAGAPCPIELMNQVMDRLGARQLTIAYGLTEASPVLTQTRADDPLEKRVETVGRAGPHLTIKIVDENGEVVPVGEKGDICARGYAVMQGYWGDPERTAETDYDEGWLHSGDLGVMDAEGYVSVVGRLKDMIIRGGENIYPREIEEFLFTHPDIQDAKVVGVPDPKYGEEVCAWVQLRDGADLTEQEIQAFCREHIAYFKVPRYVRLVREFPMTVTGKIQKFVMRDQMLEKL